MLRLFLCWCRLGQKALFYELYSILLVLIFIAEHIDFGSAHAGVAKHVLDGSHQHAEVAQQRRLSVTHVMDGYGPQAVLLTEPLKRLVEVFWVYRLAASSGEHKLRSDPSCLLLLVVFAESG